MSVADDFHAIEVALGTNGDQRGIAEQGVAVLAMLLRKNLAYGSSAFDPIRVFAKGLSALDQIHVRMDDKLSRLARGHDIDGEDTVLDLAGYCVLELVARGRATPPVDDPDGGKQGD